MTKRSSTTTNLQNAMAPRPDDPTARADKLLELLEALTIEVRALRVELRRANEKKGQGLTDLLEGLSGAAARAFTARRPRC